MDFFRAYDEVWGALGGELYRSVVVAGRVWMGDVSSG